MQDCTSTSKYTSTTICFLIYQFHHKLNIVFSWLFLFFPGKFYASKKSFSSIGKAQDQIPEMESFYSCPLCGKSYTYCTSRDTHYEKCKLMYNSKSMDNKRLYKCPKCGKPYKNSGSIANHLRLECGKEPQFRCTLCDYTSYQKFHYQRHYSSKHNLDITESSSKSNLQGILPGTDHTYY